MKSIIIISCIVIILFTVAFTAIIRKKVIKKKLTKLASPIEYENPFTDYLVTTEKSESITQPTPEKDATLNVSKPIVEILGYIKTIGKDEFYKEKLSKQNWKEKVQEIKRRDGYQCKHCYGMTLLDTIEDIRKYVDFPEVGEIVIDVFKNKESYCQPSSHEYKIISCIKKGEFYFIKLLNTNYYVNSGKVDLITMSPLNNVNTCGHYSWIETDVMFSYNVKDPTKKTNSIGTYYFVEGNTNDQLILRNIEWYKADLPYAKQGVLTFNGLSIIFPLLKIRTEYLDVHHLAYYENLEPWECPDNELITLCHSCHIKAHGKEIPIKRMIN